MIDVRKMNGRERFKLYFAIAAQRAIDRDDNVTNEFRYHGLPGVDLETLTPGVEPEAPSCQEIKEGFKEVFGFDYEDVWCVDTMISLYDWECE